MDTKPLSQALADAAEVVDRVAMERTYADVSQTVAPLMAAMDRAGVDDDEQSFAALGDVDLVTLHSGMATVDVARIIPSDWPERRPDAWSGWGD